MSEVRSVSVHLDANVASYIAKMRLAGAETDKAFGRSDAGITRTNAGLATTEQELSKVGTAARGTERDFTNLDRRLQSTNTTLTRSHGLVRTLGVAAGALGPALVPVAAVGIPAITGLTQGLGAAALGVGVTKLAFHGLGTALQAFNKAEAQPTTQNLDAARRALDALPPSARLFVVQLHAMSPALDRLRQSAASGLFPGLTAGLHDLTRDAPIVNRAVHGVGLELGSLAQQAGRSLSSNQWRPFLRFAGAEAPAALQSMASATGLASHGLASLLMDFGPLDRQMETGITRLARDFDQWASSAGAGRDIQGLMTYVEANGPKVLQILGDTGHLVGDIAKAAAPLGGPTLQAFDDLVKVLDLIAGSNAATPILALVQAMTIGKLAMAGWGKVAGATFGPGGQSSLKQYGAGIRADLALVRQLNATEKSSYLTRGETAVRDNARGRLLGNLGKAAGVLGAVGIASTGLTQKLGLTNTATDALAGAMLGGVPGAVAGGLIGAFLDTKSASDQVSRSQTQLDSALRAGTSTLGTYTAIYQQAMAERNRLISAGSNPLTHPGDVLANAYSNITGHGSIVSRVTSTATQAQSVLGNLRTAYGSIFQGLHGPTTDTFGRSMMLTLPQLQRAANRAQPAMLALGISADDLQRAAQRGDGSLDAMTHRIVTWINRADSASGRTNAVAQAFAHMSDQTLTLDQRVQGLSDTLDRRLTPGLDQSAATDAWQHSLRHLNTDLAKSRTNLFANTDAAEKNRSAVRDLVGQLKAKIVADAAAGRGAGHLSGELAAMRKRLLDAGAAAGISRGQLAAYLRQLGLTPHLVRTVLRLGGTDAAISQAQAVQAAINGIDRVVNVHVNVTRSTNALLADVNTPRPHAAGGYITGPGGPTSDDIPAWLSSGEYVVRAASVDRYGLNMMHAINAGAYASGGPVATHVTRTVGGVAAGDQGLSAQARQVSTELHRLRGSLAASRHELDLERQQRQAIAQQRAQLVSTVRDNFRSPLFGDGSTGIWGAATDPLSILRTDISNARSYRSDIGRLRHRGLRGGALAQVTTLADAQQALGLSRAEDREISRLYGIRQRASQAAGAALGNARYGAELAALQQEVHQANAHLRSLDRETKALRKEAPSNADRAGHAAAKGVNSAVKNGVKRGNHP